MKVTKLTESFEEEKCSVLTYSPFRWEELREKREREVEAEMKDMILGEQVSGGRTGARELCGNKE